MAPPPKRKRRLQLLIPYAYFVIALGLAGATAFTVVAGRLSLYSPAMLCAAFVALERAKGRRVSDRLLRLLISIANKRSEETSEATLPAVLIQSTDSAAETNLPTPEPPAMAAS